MNLKWGGYLGSSRCMPIDDDVDKFWWALKQFGASYKQLKLIFVRFWGATRVAKKSSLLLVVLISAYSDYLTPWTCQTFQTLIWSSVHWIQTPGVFFHFLMKCYNVQIQARAAADLVDRPGQQCRTQENWCVNEETKDWPNQNNDNEVIIFHDLPGVNGWIGNIWTMSANCWSNHLSQSDPLCAEVLL